MFRATDFLNQDEDDDDDHLWVCTPTPRNMSDFVSEETLKKEKEESGATAIATETVATRTMSRMDKVAHELRSRSVEVREYLTLKGKGKPKSRKKEEQREISPIRSSTPTQMTEKDREREDKAMEKGSAGKKKKAAMKGKGGSPHKTLAEEEKGKEKEERKEGSRYETKDQAGGGVIAIRQTESEDKGRRDREDAGEAEKGADQV